MVNSDQEKIKTVKLCRAHPRNTGISWQSPWETNPLPNWPALEEFLETG